MRGVGVDVGGVGVRVLSVHEPVQHDWNISHHYWTHMLKGQKNPRQSLCRGLPSAKTPRGIFRWQRGSLPRALYRALGKAFAEGQDWPSAKKSSRHGADTVSSFFAEGRPSAKKCFFFKKNFAEGFPQALGKDIFYFFLKKDLCQGPHPWPSAKKCSGFFKKNLWRGLLLGPSAKTLLQQKKITIIKL